jgi:hypothetical protein
MLKLANRSRNWLAGYELDITDVVTSLLYVSYGAIGFLLGVTYATYGTLLPW